MFQSFFDHHQVLKTIPYTKTKRVKQPRYRPGLAQRVPGS